MKQLGRLIEIIKDVAKGRYSNEVMDLAAPDVEEPVRSIAEAMGLMMVKVEARGPQVVRQESWLGLNLMQSESNRSHWPEG